MTQDIDLHRCIRASFGLVLMVLSLFLLWGEKALRDVNTIEAVESRVTVSGTEASVRASDMQLPIWTAVASTGLLVSIAWLKWFKLLEPNTFAVFALNSWSFILLASWFVSVMNDHGTIGLGLPVAFLGWCLAVKAVAFEHEGATQNATAAATASLDSSTPETQA